MFYCIHVQLKRHAYDKGHQLTNKWYVKNKGSDVWNKNIKFNCRLIGKGVIKEEVAKV